METLTNYFWAFALFSIIIFILWCVINLFIDMSGHNDSHIAHTHPHYADRSTSPSWFKKTHMVIVFTFMIVAIIITHGAALKALFEWDYSLFVIVPFVIMSIKSYFDNK